MTYKKYHDDEVPITLTQVTELVAAQFPDIDRHPLHFLASAGTDNVMLRIGDRYVLRFPRTEGSAKSLQKELTWLPQIAPYLTLKVPRPVYAGQPDKDYPFIWTIYEWLEGDTVSIEALPDAHQLATDLATFLLKMQQLQLPASDVLIATHYNRGAPLATRDDITRDNIEALRDQIDADIAYAIWNDALSANTHDDTPVWIHGDLQAGNLLTENGRLLAVIDWGAMGRGDPACDLQVAWNLLPPDARQTFREALQVDDAMWSRGRGWALSVGVIALPYYQQSNPTLAGISRRAIAATLADFKRATG